MTRPPRLRPGDRIGIVAPSGPVLRRYVVAGLKVLEAAGYRPRLSRHLYERRGHLAGTDQRRADDLNRMLRDPDIRCVLMARGGFGAMRIAADVDWGAMRRDPKVFAGYSDATFLHLGFQARSGVRTLHGPNLHGLGFGRTGEIRRWLSWLANPLPPDSIRELSAPLRIGTRGGEVSGRVLGGNLALVHHAACTPYMPSLRSAILFFEEVNEPPYKIDAMLTHIALAGSLKGVRGMALGSFVNCVPKPKHKELKLGQVLRDHIGVLGVPALGGMKAGHGPRNWALPLGARATLDSRRGRLVFEEGLVA
ncbi:MAG: LD-carboxypeptidase [Candidatus Eisenbacteria bacterium]|uniref:LD-carboxypeptidase n=1 Tax=Eiseniibacteriota bacterium TaxID=2212470 RepID=A0A538SBT3_UNCEI|nr:MAG: LD-carboxypeptidase [Candidatus Eisenbacteria bacterium]